MKHRMSKELLGLAPSGIRKFTALARQVEGCVSLTIGEPDFNTPEPIKTAAKHALDENLTHYPPNAGYDALRSRVCQFEQEKNGVCYCPEEVIIADGATEGLFLALRGILNPGDEVIVPIPAFGVYEPIIRLSGGVMIPLDTKKSGFQIDARALSSCITDRTKAILLNSPNNPTGVVYHQETLEGIYELVRDRDIFVICDDVYAQLCYGDCPSFSQFQQIREKIIVVQSFSKPYAMTGWRMGYVLAAAPIAEQLIKLHSYTVVSAVSFLQPACEQALAYDPALMIEQYRQRRDYICMRLKKMGLQTPEPEGAFYCFPSIEKYGLPSEEFCTRMIREAKLAAVPGTCFGTEGHIRLSYCYSQPELEEGLNRLEAFLKSL